MTEQPLIILQNFQGKIVRMIKAPEARYLLKKRVVQVISREPIFTIRFKQERKLD